MNPYTVLLLLPDYMRERFGSIVLLHVHALDVDNAITMAKTICATSSTPPNDPDDLLAVSVFDGHHQSLV